MRIAIGLFLIAALVMLNASVLGAQDAQALSELPIGAIGLALGLMTVTILGALTVFLVTGEDDRRHDR